MTINFFSKKCFFFLLLLSSTVFGNIREKRAYIITGPESSGSRFISRVIAYVLGKDQEYNQWTGGGMNGKIGDDLVILHYSQPSYRPAKFLTLDQFHELFNGYELYFIITTRDVTIVDKSKRKHFNCQKECAHIHRETSKAILSEILLNEKCFIWNYETQIYLKEAYFQMLYDFLQIKSDFFPTDLVNGNKKYFPLKAS